MYLERLLQINMAALAALGALLLGMGQRSEFPPLLVALAAVLSVWLTDVTGRFRITRQVANVLMLLAGAITLCTLFPLYSEVQAFGLARLLICIQIIVLFQRKDERLYWLLVMLSLLQVVVATLFSQGVWFGFLLTAYMMLGFSAMTLLLLFRQWGQGTAGPACRAGLGGRGLVTPAGSRPAGGTCAPPPPRRWPLAARPAEFVSFPSGSDRAGLGRDLFRRLTRATAYTLALTAVLFFALPRSRLGQADWGGALSHQQTLVGFSDKVNLGEMGEIADSPDPVMRVWFSDYYTNKPLPVNGEIYLNGAYLLTYRNGQWHTGSTEAPGGDSLGLKQLERERPLPRSGLAVQTIRLEAVIGQELFYVSPFISLTSDYRIQRDLGTEKLLRAIPADSHRFQYSLGTTAIVGGKQLGLRPTRNNTQFNHRERQLPRDKNGHDPLQNLKALARRWIAESGLPENDRLGRARLLEQKFLSSGRFEYSLVGQKRDTTIDPIEDFVTNHPKGHCEYFATALALMLRSIGISAHVVSGFKCDEKDSTGGYYQVRQRHAHTWVEAYVRARQLPPELMHGKDVWPWSDGGWIRLDPTPGGEDRLRTHWYSPVSDALDWVDSKWSNYVVELDFDRQRDAIYQPIAALILAGWQEATDPSRWHAILGSVGMANYLDHLSREVRWLLVAGAAAVLAVLLVVAVGLLARLVRRRRGRRGRDPSPHAPGWHVEVGFYRRLETLLARQGLVRAAAQTQREFALAAGHRLAASTGQPRLASLPPLVADAFYRVRFGRAPLDKIQAQAVEHALLEIAACKRQRGG